MSNALPTIQPHTVEALRKAIADAPADPRTGAAFVNIDTRILAALLQMAGPDRSTALAACQAVLDEFPASDGKRIESVKSICRAALKQMGA